MLRAVYKRYEYCLNLRILFSGISGYPMFHKKTCFYIFLCNLILLPLVTGCLSDKETTQKQQVQESDELASVPETDDDKTSKESMQATKGQRTLLAKSMGSIRYATYNSSLYRKRSGQLIKSLASEKDQQAAAIAEVIQRVRPDVLLLNEFDYDSEHRSAALFQKLYLAKSQSGQEPINFPFVYTAPSNTGVPSGQDFNNDGKIIGGNDAFGYGRHPGQYGMVVYSQYPIDKKSLRTFQTFLWKDMPNAMLPTLSAPRKASSAKPFYNDEELAIFRLASKSFWDVPIVVSGKKSNTIIHFLVSHPTPPVFDGEEDRNGKRNHDEIRMLADYISPERSKFLYDDAGKYGGLPPKAKFIIAGDLNADPNDGESADRAILQLLKHPKILATKPPSSQGGHIAATTYPNLNAKHKGNPRFDTADFGSDGVGNLRVDYVLPSKTLTITSSGIFWPLPGEASFSAASKTDHRMTWIDVTPE